MVEAGLMEIMLFAAVFCMVTAAILAAGPMRGNPRPPAPLTVSMPDLPEGEMHLAELVVFTTLLSLFAVVVATALAAA